MPCVASAERVRPGSGPPIRAALHAQQLTRRGDRRPQSGADPAAWRWDGVTPASFTIADDQFLLNGVPIRILAGEIHYFRIPRAYWRDRLERLAANGYNAIQTCAPPHPSPRAPPLQLRPTRRA